VSVQLIWATPDADRLLAYIARVSNPKGQANEKIEKLLHYMEREGHVSPFTMANMCVEVNTTRAIGRQMLRHWSLAVQEFSQRYEDVTLLGEFTILECRMQDTKNRQNSLEDAPSEVAQWFEEEQKAHIAQSQARYTKALELGIAKEQARCFLPEGNTPSRLYFNGTIRSWIHYLRQRTHESTQKEHRVVACDIEAIFKEVVPVTHKAFFD
jgi:thymidylate synthase (FAD)